MAASAMPSALATGQSAVDDLSSRTDMAEARIMDVVRVIGGAMIGIAVLVVVLNEVFALDAINNSTGSFSGVIDSLETTGAAALGLLVIGLLVLGANRVMGFFGGGGF
jgi:uncharacterized membrane protein YesL